MSSMAFSMYLFTRGEGTLRTTQDLFTQAYYFVEEGTRLSAIIHEFANQVRFDRKERKRKDFMGIFRSQIKQQDKIF
jgi:hypothetical protein